MSKKEVIIVGAGPGGLTSAMILAHRGFKVTVFEKAPEVGGRNAPIRLDGFTFDTGPTFLMMNFILREMFEETGRKPEDYINVTRLEPMYRLKFSNFQLKMTGDRQEMHEELASVFPGSFDGYELFMQDQHYRFEKLFPCIQKPYSRLSDFLDMKLLRAVSSLAVGSTMFDKLGEYFAQDSLRLAFTFQAKYLGMSAWECPAFFTIIPLVEHAYGIYHVQGGLNAISLAMEKIIIEEGGTVVKNAPVKRVLVQDRTITGIELENGETHSADEYILNADFGYAMKELFNEADLRKYKRSRIDRMGFSCSIFMLYLGVDKLYDIPHHNVFFADDYKTNVDDVFKRLVLSDDFSFYIQNASRTDPTLAPEGKSTVYVLVPVPNNRSGINWEEQKQDFKNKLLDRIQKRTELKDIRQHIVAEKVITPADWERDYNVCEGATFNLKHNWGQMLYFRPHNQFEEFDNCYLTGGGTHPGSGLPTIYESARISANLLCKKYGVAFAEPTTLTSKKPLS
jgi:phytoene desaturase